MYGEKLSELDTYMKWEMSIYFGIKKPISDCRSQMEKICFSFH